MPIFISIAKSAAKMNYVYFNLAEYTIHIYDDDDQFCRN